MPCVEHDGALEVIPSTSFPMSRMTLKYTGILATLLPAFTLGAAPTWTLGPTSDYVVTPAIQITPTGTQLFILPTPEGSVIPSSGIDMYLGPDLQDALSDAFKNNCASGMDQQCADSVFKALDGKRGYTIQSRNLLALGAAEAVGALIAAGIAGLQYMIVMMESRIAGAERVRPFVHLASSDLAQMQSHTDSTLIFKTASTASASTVTAPPLTVAPTPATITTLTADGNGHKSGDVIIALPTDTADLLRQLIAQWGAPENCASKPSKRDEAQADNSTASSNHVFASKSSGGGVPDFDGIEALSKWILPMAAPGQLLNDLNMGANQILPRLRDANEASLEVVQAAALGVMGFATGDMANLVAEAIWLAAYDVCVNNVPDLLELVLDESMIDENPDDQNKKCPPETIDSPLCDDSSCAGSNGLCTVGDDAGCVCHQTVTYWYYPGNETMWDASQELIDELLGIRDTPGTNVDGGSLVCGTQNDMGNPRDFVALATMNSAAAFFCQKQADGKTQFPATKFVDLDYNFHYNDPVYLAMNWTDGDNCPSADFTNPGMLDACKERFGTIINNCDTVNNQHFNYWKQGGTFLKDCVTWTIRRDSFTGDPNPITTDDSWRPYAAPCKQASDCNSWPRCGTVNGKFIGTPKCLPPDPQFSDQGWCACTFST